MSNGVLVTKGTLTLPVGVLRTLHYGVSEVRHYRSTATGADQVGKRVSLLGREETLMVEEAAMLRSIEHDNIADVYEVAELAGSDPALAMYEIMMPFYELGSVFDAMIRRDARFNVGTARDLAVAALRGLAHLHDHERILHRDVKPGNLFLSGDRHLVKVGDFGEAVRMDEDKTSEPLVTPRFWTPPECFTGARHTVAAEIYSMGLSLHEMLSGPFPYDAYTIDTLAGRLSSGRSALLPRDLAHAVHVPDSMRRVVRKAIRKEPDERFQAADEMTAALLRAAFIDWSWPVAEDDETVEWAGSFRADDYRVRVRPIRGAGWRARGERRFGTGWRRTQSCEFDSADRDQAADLAFCHLDRFVAKA